MASAVPSLTSLSLSASSQEVKDNDFSVIQLRYLESIKRIVKPIKNKINDKVFGEEPEETIPYNPIRIKELAIQIVIKVFKQGTLVGVGGAKVNNLKIFLIKSGKLLWAYWSNKKKRYN